jgi:hypothetical protein
MYADDLKVYRKISNTHDCEMLQRDIIRIQEWCKCNNLFLNVQKCHAMSYTNKSTTILFDYHIDHCLLTRDNMICDLGITFDTRLTFSNHINVIVVSGALRSLGFIIRCTKNFSDIRSLKMLYFAFVRSRTFKIWKKSSVVFLSSWPIELMVFIPKGVARNLNSLSVSNVRILRLDA